MALNIQDIQPQPFTIKISKQEVTCQPPRMSHALILTQIGAIFENPQAASKVQIKQAEANFTELVEELIPELKGIQLDFSTSMQIINQIMDKVVPSEAKALEDNNISIEADPKAERTG